MSWMKARLRKFETHWKLESVYPIALFFMLLVFSVQIFLWRKFAFEASNTQIKLLFANDPEPYLLDLGAMCNSLKDFKCSKRQFRKVLDKNPYQRNALANLGIASAQLKEWDKARTYFESYFSIGGSAGDVMYWYAESIEALEGREAAVWWYYESLAILQENPKALEKLVMILLQLGRYHEAASAIASVHHGQLNENSSELELFDQSMNLWESHQFKTPGEMMLPSFFEEQLFAGVRLSANSRWRIASINFEYEKVVLNEDLISESFLRVPAQSLVKTSLHTPVGTFEVSSVKVPELLMLGHTFKDVTVYYCAECPTIVGRAIMDQFTHEEFQKGSVKYFVLSQGF